MAKPDPSAARRLVVAALVVGTWSGCGARSAIDGSTTGEGEGGFGPGASLAVGATASTGGDPACATILVPGDGEGGVRLEAVGSRLVYTGASGSLVRVDLPLMGTTSAPIEQILVRGVEPAADIAVFEGFVYHVRFDDDAFVVARIPIDGGMVEDLFLARGRPLSIEVDETGVYVLDDVGPFSGRVVRLDADGGFVVLAEGLLDASMFAIDDDRIVGIGSLFSPNGIDSVYAVPKLGGPVSTFGGSHFGVDFVRKVPGGVFWFEPSTTAAGTGDLFRLDGEVPRLIASLPKNPITFDADTSRFYATAIEDVAQDLNAVYALDRDTFAATRILEDGPERFPTEIRVAGGRVAWTIQRRSGFVDDVPSVRVECTTLFR